MANQRVNLNPGTLEAPLPAVLVTVRDGERDNIMTAAWTGILSSDPARAYVSVRPRRFTHDMLEHSREFVIHLTTEDLAYATDYCGIYTGAKVDKFEKLGLTKVPSKCVAAPTVAECPVALECRVFDVVRSGTHDIYMADVVNVSVDESLLDKDGRLRLDRAKLIAYSHGEYFALGRVLGKFGFSAAKGTKKTQKTAKKPAQKPENQDRNPPKKHPKTASKSGGNIK